MAHKSGGILGTLGHEVVFRVFHTTPELNLSSTPPLSFSRPIRSCALLLPSLHPSLHPSTPLALFIPLHTHPSTSASGRPRFKRQRSLHLLFFSSSSHSPSLSLSCTPPFLPSSLWVSALWVCVGVHASCFATVRKRIRATATKHSTGRSFYFQF